MNKQKITFQNPQGISLSGLLEAPEAPSAYALFAHCFTCGKDIKAAARISKALVDNNVAVLRFDFTGLGSSEGDFSNSNFSSKESPNKPSVMRESPQHLIRAAHEPDELFRL